MKEYLDILQSWEPADELVLVRVIRTWGSSPRPVGSIMLVHPNGQVAGSVSGGCVEGAVTKKAQEVLQKGESEIVQFGVSDEQAWNVGLSCGGSIEVYLQKINLSDNGLWSKLIQCAKHNQAAVLMTSMDAGSSVNSLLDESGQLIGDPISTTLQDEAERAYNERTNRTVEVDGRRFFLHVFPRKEVLLVIGAAHITVDLVSLGQMFGFETVVIDPRGYFTTHTSFSTPPDQLLEAYPSEVLDQFKLDAFTYCAILSHDPKIDDNALEVLLPSRVAYIGALGSKKTHAKRVARLQEKGISEKLIAKIKAPIGVPIHAKSAKEIAFISDDEIIAVKNQYT